MPKVVPHIRVSDEVRIESKPDPCGLVIFGASGDLTSRKLIPALYSLWARGHLPLNFFILGCGRSQMDDGEFRQRVREDLAGKPEKNGGDGFGLEAFVERCYFSSGPYSDLAFYLTLHERLDELARRHGTGHNVLFYLALPPNLYSVVTRLLSRAGLAAEKEGWSRVIIEKPFGSDLKSALELDKQVHRALKEHQIYRIDHYLGKETVQNILMFRFANAIFEPLFNRRYVDFMEITVAEDIGVGERAGYFEQAGMARDMFQNHMMQLLSLVAMEPPASFSAESVRDEKVKLLRAIRPFDLNRLDEQVVRGQYAAGTIGGKTTAGYREEKGVAAQSMVETFLAARLSVDNWRWQGVPIYMRTGKRLGRRVSEIAITFRHVPHSMFHPMKPEDLAPNRLVMNVQPDEGISLRMQAKHPGARLCMSSLEMDFKYSEVFGEPPGEAYERLLLDAMLGDQTLFVRSDEMQVAWGLVTPLLKRWEAEGVGGKVYPYAPSTWGPPEADALLAGDGNAWRKID